MHKKTISNNGFTIVELLVVIVVIGVLAAISLVSYTNVANQANTASVKTDISNSDRTLKIYHVEKGLYPVDVVANCATDPSEDIICLELSGGNEIDKYEPSGDRKNFTLSIKNGTNIIWEITDNSTAVSIAPEPLTAVAAPIGTAAEFSVLTAGATTPAAAATTASYQWQRADDSGFNTNRVDIPGATSSTYALATADVDKYVRVKVTGPARFYGTQYSSGVGAITAPFGTGAQGDVTIGAGQTVNINTLIASYNGSTTIPQFDNLTINGTLTTSALVPLYFKVRGTLTIAAAGKIDASGKGYNGANGYGAGRGSSYSSWSISGAGYGGAGGTGGYEYNCGYCSCDWATIAGGPTYGASPADVTFGSTSDTKIVGGGGLVKIYVRILSNSGQILVNGGAGLGVDGQYSGSSGGGLLIASSSVVDGSKLFAYGGNSAYLSYNGSGGGGRIKIMSPSYTTVPAGNIAGGSGAGAGTVQFVQSY